MRNRRSLVESDTLEEINISPLIDMVFILLIFFIVTTVFVEETGVEVDKPQAVSASQLDKNSVLLAITAEGQVVYGGREIGLAGVRPLVKRLTQREQIPVIIQGDKQANYGLAIQVYDECKLADAKDVSFAAVGPGI
ncbi:MAG: biopolymer transporter ExbD [Verrucomicrobiae bacterium]|jgi:biopolymer transport protein ExbD|nr:biopolymer transporter ExbD [Verrucomicrobiae bacterium]